jgi:hypothetical protein
MENIIALANENATKYRATLIEKAKERARAVVFKQKPKCNPDPFKDVPLFKGFQTFDKSMLLQLSLSDYFQVFQANDSPAGITVFNKDRNSINQTVSKGEWFSPPEAKYTEF